MVGQEESLSGRQMEQSQVKSKGVSGSRCVLPCGWTGAMGLCFAHGVFVVEGAR